MNSSSQNKEVAKISFMYMLAKSKQFELVHCKAYIWNFNSN